MFDPCNVGYVIFPLRPLDKLRDDSRFTAKFTPVLRPYIKSDYEETAILRGQVDTLRTGRRTSLRLHRTLLAISDLARGAVTGRYTIDYA
ncbi:uncharacterized protein F5147DRAFT_782867 [Suillus discolor]|uniref:Uncharacterized protein n=1 Tax=Suillus discolor TaxID=1912936 RepID=A0A9P7JL34_9AGAM|nr:uncharacterized protein F5147DRAFT_782867 [Suillus discolor]KAG2083570.1 hypothetical protein F5147DRAFT_782867 [Suillus discolor]